jgi:hypothetical protein
MPTWMIAFVFSAGIAGFIYGKLLHSNGQPSAGRDAIAALVVFALTFVVLFTLFKFVLGFD